MSERVEKGTAQIKVFFGSLYLSYPDTVVNTMGERNVMGHPFCAVVGCPTYGASRRVVMIIFG